MGDISLSKSYRAVLRHRRSCKWWNDSYLISHRPVCFDCFGGGLNKFNESLDRELGERYSSKELLHLEKELYLCLKHGDRETRSNHKHVIKSVLKMFREGSL